MNASNSKRVPIWKLFGKLRSLIAVVPHANEPRRSWDHASTREIQLEFDFELRGRIRGGRAAISTLSLSDKSRDHEVKSWGRN